MAYYKEMTEKKNDLITRAEDVLNKAKMEKRELTDAEAQEIAEIRDNVRRIIKSLNLKDDVEELDDRERGCAKKKGGEGKNAVSDTPTDDEKAKMEKRAFDAYVRGNILNERAVSNLTETDNGAIIPKTIANQIIKKVYDISPILAQSSKFNVKGTLEIPYYDETDNAITVAYANEFESLSSNVGKFKTIELSGFLAGTLVLISRKLINNSQFDVTNFVVNEMSEHIARFVEGELLNGTAGKVTGLSTLTNSMTAASATAITADEIITMKGNIKDVYQNNAIWIMNPATRNALRLLKDQMGRYLLNDDISSPFGTTLLGKPVYVSDNMPTIAAGKTAIYYGDMSGIATKFSEDINIQILRERYADQHAVGAIGWLDFDGKVADAQKITKLVMKNS
jgi:HK97 family phage major capsid protein